MGGSDGLANILGIGSYEAEKRRIFELQMQQHGIMMGKNIKATPKEMEQEKPNKKLLLLKG